jgi:hypothetical protein
MQPICSEHRVPQAGKMPARLSVGAKAGGGPTPRFLTLRTALAVMSTQQLGVQRIAMWSVGGENRMEHAVTITKNASAGE